MVRSSQRPGSSVSQSGSSLPRPSGIPSPRTLGPYRSRKSTELSWTGAWPSWRLPQTPDVLGRRYAPASSGTGEVPRLRRPLAEQNLLEAQRWYDGQRKGLGADIVRADKVEVIAC